MVFNIGIDIGGTHTDAVLVDCKGILIRSTKTLTTACIQEGVFVVLKKLLEFCLPQEIAEVRVGTTHATNAILEAKNLLNVGVIRLTGKGAPLIPVAFGWSEALSARIAKTVVLGGGFESDGRERSSLCDLAIDEAVLELLAAGANAIAVTSSFSPIYPNHEWRVRDRIKNIPVCCSSDISGLGFIERENTTILNLLLRDVLRRGFSELQNVLEALSIQAPLFLTHNEGSLLELNEAIEKPILTLSSGQTNSFLGAARLHGVMEAVVVDIGGTTTDIGVIKNGYPRKTVGAVDIAGIPLNFPMPDVLSVAIGGGSLIIEESIGPKSCGKNLFSQASCFGGSNLTLTCLAIRAGAIAIDGANPELVSITVEDAIQAHKKAFVKIHDLALKMQSSTNLVPILVVGGGSFLFKKYFESAGFFMPQNGGVANAYGAALAETASSIDTVISLDDPNTIEILKKKVMDRAISRGADPKTVRLTQVDVIPYHYLGGQKARVIVTAAG